MALSGREVLLVLRARDEATRAINRVSSSMRRMDRDATTSAGRQIDSQRQALTQLQRQLGDVNHAYSRTTAAALERHRAEMRNAQAQMATVRDQERQVRAATAAQVQSTRDLHAAGRISDAQRDAQIRSARELSSTQLAALSAQRAAIHDTSRVSQERYQKEIASARRLHIQQQEQIRQQRYAAQDAIVRSQKELDAIENQRAALRDRGHALMNNGAAAVGAGAAMTYMGIEGVRAFGSTVQASMDFEQQARRTLTQVDNNKIGLEDIEKLGKRIGDTVPVAFEEIQPALYDIFSSIDVGMGGARKLLRQFAKDAVGGQASMETATRANLAIMNAFKVETKDAGKVSDFMFQLVRKGVGSYDEFAHAIGRAIPSARRAGQSYQTLGGMMAFLTRNGLSAAMAATSSARALDALSHPATVEKLGKLGIEVRNASGEFKPLKEILGDMNEEFGDMTAPQRAKALQELFKGSGGTIQARRFFDNYFKNVDEFNQRTEEMQHTAGAAKDAFDKMAESPAAKLQQLKNDWELFRIEMGENLMPTAIKLMDKLNDFLDWYKKLDPETKEAIAHIGAFGAALMVLMGTLTMVGGSILILKGSINALGMSAGKFSGRMAGLTVGLGLIADGMQRTEEKASDADKAIGIMEAGLGGAALGATVGSVFGPIGTAIGAVGGAAIGTTAQLVKLHNQAGKKGEWVGAKEVASDYASTLDQVTGAATKATRAMVYQNLEASGVADSMRFLGVDQRDMIDAVLGSENAYLRVKKAVEKYGGTLENLEGQNVKKWMLDQGAAFGRASREANNAAEALVTWADELKGVPKKVVTKLDMVDFKPTHDEFQQIIKDHKLTPKQIKIIVDAIGFDPLHKNMKNVKSEMKDLDNVKYGGGKWRAGLLDALRGGEEDTRQHVNNMKKHMAMRDAKADLQGFNRGVSDWMRTTNATSSRGANQIANTLKSGTGRARADLSGFNSSLASAISNAQGQANSGGAGIGASLASGVAGGIAANAWQAVNAAAAMVADAVAAARSRKGADAHSPSRKTMRLGRDMVHGLARGMDKHRGKAKSSAGKLATAIVRTMQAGLRDKGSELSSIMSIVDRMFKKADKKDLSRVRGRLTDEMRHMDRLEAQFMKRAKKLAKAREKLAARRSQYSSYKSNVASTIRDFAGFGGFEQPTDVFGNEEPVTFDYISTTLTGRLNTVKAFGSKLRELRKMGYSNAIVNMVVQLGPEKGLEYAKALLQAKPKQVKALNMTQRDIGTAAENISTKQAKEMYQAGINAAEGLVRGLQRKENAVKRAARKLGRHIVAAIRAALKMKSPSRVGIDIGANFGGSVASGMRTQARDVDRASRLLAAASQFETHARTPRPPVVGATTQPGTGAPSKTIKIDQHITTQELNPRVHAAQLGWELAARFKV